MLDSLVAALPAKVQPYAKTYTAAILSLLVALSAVTPVPSWVTVVIAVMSAPAVFAVPNKGYWGGVEQADGVDPENADNLPGEGEGV